MTIPRKMFTKPYSILILSVLNIILKVSEEWGPVALINQHSKTCIRIYQVQLFTVGLLSSFYWSNTSAFGWFSRLLELFYWYEICEMLSLSRSNSIFISRIDSFDCIICKATFYNRSHWNWSIGTKDTGIWRVAKKEKGKKTNKQTNKHTNKQWHYLLCLALYLKITICKVQLILLDLITHRFIIWFVLSYQSKTLSVT